MERPCYRVCTGGEDAVKAAVFPGEVQGTTDFQGRRLAGGPHSVTCQLCDAGQGFKPPLAPVSFSVKCSSPQRRTIERITRANGVGFLEQSSTKRVYIYFSILTRRILVVIVADVIKQSLVPNGNFHTFSFSSLLLITLDSSFSSCICKMEQQCLPLKICVRIKRDDGVPDQCSLNGEGHQREGQSEKLPEPRGDQCDVVSRVG